MGVKEVCAHASHVPHVVPYVVCDNRGVARVVFGDAQFNLTHEICGDIRGFGEDAAARFGKEGQRRGSEAEAQGHGRIASQDHDARNTEEARADHGHAHDRSAPKADHKGFFHAFGSCGGCPRVGNGGYIHANFPCQTRKHGTGDVSYGHENVPFGFPVPDGLGQEE